MSIVSQKVYPLQWFYINHLDSDPRKLRALCRFRCRGHFGANPLRRSTAFASGDATVAMFALSRQRDNEGTGRTHPFHSSPVTVLPPLALFDFSARQSPPSLSLFRHFFVNTLRARGFSFATPSLVIRRKRIGNPRIRSAPGRVGL